MKVLAGKRALITGAAAGIGRAMALALAREGVDLYLADIDERRLREVVDEAKQHGVKAVGARCDVACPAAITATVDALLSTWGGLDILINNAGVCHYGPTEEMTDGQWDSTLRINLLAPIQLTRQLLPVLLAQEEAHILNVCSIAGLVASRRLAAYQVTKFGLVGLGESLRAEYRRRGLGVTSLCPGFVRTGMLDSSDLAARRKSIITRWLSTTPEAVAVKAVKAIRKNRSLVLVTPLAHLMWALKRLAPRGIHWRRARKRGKSSQAMDSAASAA